jgi:3-dehydroquinate synthase class II
MQSDDDEKHFATVTLEIKRNPTFTLQSPLEEDEELLVISQNGELNVVSKIGTRFVNVARLCPGDKLIIEVNENADG